MLRREVVEGELPRTHSWASIQEHMNGKFRKY